MPQPRSQGLSSLPPLSSTTMEAEKRDPGNEVGYARIFRLPVGAAEKRPRISGD